MALARSYQRSFVVTASRHLQDQYASDFEAVPAKGKANFPCFKAMEQEGIDLQEYGTAMARGLTGDKGECEEASEDGRRKNCKFKPHIVQYKDGTFDEIVCPYYEQKFSALLADHSVWNYYSYFQVVKHNQGPYGDYLRDRVISVFDESHSMEDQIMRFVGIRVCRGHAGECGIRVEPRRLSDTDSVAALLDDMARPYARKAMEVRESEAFRRRPDYGAVSRLDRMHEAFADARFEVSSDPGNFIINEAAYDGGRFESVEIRPLDISRYVERFIVTPYQIFMSATVDKESFCQNTGIQPDEVALVETPRSPFPPENRRVEFVNAAKLSHRSPRGVEGIVWEKIDQILSRHGDQRGLILTSSVARCVDISENVSPGNRERVRICHATNPGGRTQRDIIREHAESDNGVLVSSSLWQGVDLKDDLSRFQVIAKAPFPNPTERWVAAKMSRYPLWYRSQVVTKILQGLGRSVRGRRDWAVTYVLDSAVEPLLNDSRDLVPKPYHDVLGWG